MHNLLKYLKQHPALQVAINNCGKNDLCIRKMNSIPSIATILEKFICFTQGKKHLLIRKIYP